MRARASNHSYITKADTLIRNAFTHEVYEVTFVIAAAKLHEGDQRLRDRLQSLSQSAGRPPEQSRGAQIGASGIARRSRLHGRSAGLLTASEAFVLRMAAHTDAAAQVLSSDTLLSPLRRCVEGERPPGP